MGHEMIVGVVVVLDDGALDVFGGFVHAVGCYALRIAPMNLARKVEEVFQGFPFGAPATPEDLLRAEEALGHPVPPPLRELYLAFDGFSGPTHAQFFWPLFAPNGLVEFNRFLRNGDEFPHDFVSSCVFFGDEGVGSMWGIKQDLPDSIILWDATWGEEYEVVGTCPLEVWEQAKGDYDELLNRPST